MSVKTQLTDRSPTQHTESMNATEYLQQVLGISPVMEQPDPSIPRGILQTPDYIHFQLYSDAGDLLLEFEGAKKANRCLPGDHVQWNAVKEQCELELSDEHPLLVGTLEMTNKTRYGMTKRKHPMVLFTPYDKRYPPLIVGTSEKDMTYNRVALVKVDEWPAGTLFPRGHLQHILGATGDFVAETTALIHQACPWTYRPDEVRACENPPFQETGARQLLEGYTFNIDPAGCRDVDDVFTFSPTERGGWTVTISISDVSGYVEDGSAVDIMASLIGQTLYDAEGRVLRPMLPAPYSEGACSLLPGKESYAVSLQFQWADQQITNPQWMLTRLYNNYSYTYEEFQESNSVYKAPLAEIASHLANSPITDAHEWVAQMMIYYNTEAGKWLKQAGQGGILRRHSAPDQARLLRMKESNDERLMKDLGHLAFSSAEYCHAEEKETDHYGLRADAYAHASSPIRRYTDLINQRILKYLIGGNTEHWIVPVTMVDLNRRDKAVRRFARDMDFLRAACDAENRVFDARIVEKEAIDAEWMKVRFYVPAWRRVIATTYKRTDTDDEVWSRDETARLNVTLFREVQLTCTFDLRGRNWKDRVIFSFS